MSDKNQIRTQRERDQRERPQIQAGISQKSCFRVLSSKQSTLPQVSCSSSVPYGSETKRQLGEAQDPVQKQACPFSPTPTYVHFQSEPQEDSLASHSASFSSLLRRRRFLLYSSSGVVELVLTSDHL